MDKQSSPDIALLPCPFCAHEKVEVIYREIPLSKWRYTAECKSTTCGAAGSVGASKSEAAENWNTRAVAATPIEQLSASNEQRGRDLVTVIAQRDAAERELAQARSLAQPMPELARDLATKLLDFIDNEGPCAKAWQPITEVAAALRAALRAQAATPSDPVAWWAYCEKTGGQMMKTASLKDTLIEEADNIYAEHGYVLRPLYAGVAQSKKEPK